MAAPTPVATTLSDGNFSSILANGIPNPLSTGYTGDIMMTTNGIAATDDENDDNVGFFIVEVLKK